MSEGETVGFDAEEVASQDDGEFKTGQADLGIDSGGDDMFDEDELGFDGTEESKDESSGGESSERSTPSGPSIQDSINSGLGRAAVYGLDDPDKSQLETEFTEIAEAFHVGYFGEQVVEEYFSKDIEEIPPEWGLAAASIAFAVVVIQRRPDGEEIIRDARWKMSDLKQQYVDDGPDPTTTTPTESQTSEQETTDEDTTEDDS